MPLAELSVLLTPDLAPESVGIQVQLIEVGRCGEKGLAGFHIKLGIRLNP